MSRARGPSVFRSAPGDVAPHRRAGGPAQARRAARLTAACVALCLLLAAGAGCRGDTDAGDAAAAASTAQSGTAPVRDPGYTRGAPGARVTVIEFSDFGCTFCRQFALNTYPELHRTWIESGQVRWRYVAFVSGNFPNADRATMAAECAADQGEDAFWAMKDAIYETQREWRVPGAGDAPFVALAQALGIDAAALEACMASNAAGRRIQASNRMASLGGVTATPTFFVEGRRALGALTAEQFGGLLEAVLAGR